MCGPRPSPQESDMLCQVTVAFRLQTLVGTLAPRRNARWEVPRASDRFLALIGRPQFLVAMVAVWDAQRQACVQVSDASSVGVF